MKLFDHGVDIDEPGSFGEYQLTYRTGDILSPRLDTLEPLLAEAKHFVECVRTGLCPRTDGLNGVRVVQALERAEENLLANSAGPLDGAAWTGMLVPKEQQLRTGTFGEGFH